MRRIRVGNARNGMGMWVREVSVESGWKCKKKWGIRMELGMDAGNQSENLSIAVEMT